MSAMGLGRVKTHYGIERNDARRRSDARFPWVGLCLDSRHERVDAHDVHHAGEIVGQYVQGHL